MSAAKGKKIFRILSIDGGGLRGVIPLLILKEVKRRLGNIPVREAFDLITGTSTGGIIACGLATGLTIDDILELYRSKGDFIFPRGNYFTRNFRNMRSYAFYPEFGNSGLKNVLKNYFEDKKLSDCSPTPVIVPSYDIKHDTTVFFATRYTHNKSTEWCPDKDISLVDVCLATSAAPTYLPPHSFEYVNELGNIDKRNVLCIDGGVYINNPAMSAIVDVLKYGEDPIYNYINGLENIHVLSLGTGNFELGFSERIKRKHDIWGRAWWIKPLINTMMLGTSQVTDRYMNVLLNVKSSINHSPLNDRKNYLRLQVNLNDEKLSSLTNASNQAYLYLKDATERQIINHPHNIELIEKFVEEGLLAV